MIPRCLILIFTGFISNCDVNRTARSEPFSDGIGVVGVRDFETPAVMPVRVEIQSRCAAFVIPDGWRILYRFAAFLLRICAIAERTAQTGQAV